eukprot:12423596-Karenia_brevis.AAC.1
MRAKITTRGHWQSHLQKHEIQQATCSQVIRKAWRHCSRRCNSWGLSFDVISFHAAISACEKGAVATCGAIVR